MALSRIKTWIAGETLSAADLNAEYNNILNNGAGSLSSPRTATFDLDGYACILDGAGGAYFQAASTDILDLYGASTRLFRWDMSAATPVNGLTLAASATGSDVTATAYGSDTDISINIVPKGSGVLKINGSQVSTAAADNDQSILSAQVFG